MFNIFRFVFVLIFLFSCSDPSSTSPVTKTIEDIDGNVYSIVKIGDQWWMAENLKVTHYNNGDPIPKVTNSNDWANLDSGACCAPVNSDANIDTLGLFYNWHAIADSRKIAVAGWHIPTYAEIHELEEYLNLNYEYPGKALASKTRWWESSYEGAVGNDMSQNNMSGFNGLPSGFRVLLHPGNWDFHDGRQRGIWWYLNESNPSSSQGFDIYYQSSDVNIQSAGGQGLGFGVRCIQD
jgi:uncharacterized protein (TIGR02145 family)